MKCPLRTRKSSVRPSAKIPPGTDDALPCRTCASGGAASDGTGAVSDGVHSACARLSVLAFLIDGWAGGTTGGAGANMPPSTDGMLVDFSAIRRGATTSSRSPSAYGGGLLKSRSSYVRLPSRAFSPCFWDIFVTKSSPVSGPTASPLVIASTNLGYTTTGSPMASPPSLAKSSKSRAMSSCVSSAPSRSKEAHHCLYVRAPLSPRSPNLSARRRHWALPSFLADLFSSRAFRCLFSVSSRSAVCAGLSSASPL
mmetsp:Transcript_10415/g.27054  ORF Transcript_10415/g.27054 Transcript_10415/m.27054 type:complete len:254 (+) Transcript_10415:197-958(+)